MSAERISRASYYGTLAAALEQLLLVLGPSDDYLNTQDHKCWYGGLFKLEYLDPPINVNRYDNWFIGVDTSLGHVSITTYNISYHNGDSYGESTKKYPITDSFSQKTINDIRKKMIDLKVKELAAELEKERVLQLERRAEAWVDSLLGEPNAT